MSLSPLQLEKRFRLFAAWEAGYLYASQEGAVSTLAHVFFNKFMEHSHPGLELCPEEIPLNNCLLAPVKETVASEIEKRFPTAAKEMGVSADALRALVWGIATGCEVAQKTYDCPALFRQAAECLLQSAKGR